MVHSSTCNIGSSACNSSIVANGALDALLVCNDNMGKKNWINGGFSSLMTIKNGHGGVKSKGPLRKTFFEFCLRC